MFSMGAPLSVAQLAAISDLIGLEFAPPDPPKLPSPFRANAKDDKRSLFRGFSGDYTQSRPVSRASTSVDPLEAFPGYNNQGIVNTAATNETDESVASGCRPPSPSIEQSVSDFSSRISDEGGLSDDEDGSEFDNVEELERLAELQKIEVARPVPVVAEEPIPTPEPLVIDEPVVVEMPTTTERPTVAIPSPVVHQMGDEEIAELPEILTDGANTPIRPESSCSQRVCTKEEEVAVEATEDESDDEESSEFDNLENLNILAASNKDEAVKKLNESTAPPKPDDPKPKKADAAPSPADSEDANTSDIEGPIPAPDPDPTFDPEILRQRLSQLPATAKEAEAEEEEEERKPLRLAVVDSKLESIEDYNASFPAEPPAKEQAPIVSAVPVVTELVTPNNSMFSLLQKKTNARRLGRRIAFPGTKPIWECHTPRGVTEMHEHDEDCPNYRSVRQNSEQSEASTMVFEDQPSVLELREELPALYQPNHEALVPVARGPELKKRDEALLRSPSEILEMEKKKKMVAEAEAEVEVEMKVPETVKEVVSVEEKKMREVKKPELVSVQQVFNGKEKRHEVKVPEVVQKVEVKVQEPFQKAVHVEYKRQEPQVVKQVAHVEKSQVEEKRQKRQATPASAPPISARVASTLLEALQLAYETYPKTANPAPMTLAHSKWASPPPPATRLETPSIRQESPVSSTKLQSKPPASSPAPRLPTTQPSRDDPAVALLKQKHSVLNSKVQRMLAMAPQQSSRPQPILNPARTSTGWKLVERREMTPANRLGYPTQPRPANRKIVADKLGRRIIIKLPPAPKTTVTVRLPPTSQTSIKAASQPVPVSGKTSPPVQAAPRVATAGSKESVTKAARPKLPTSRHSSSKQSTPPAAPVQAPLPAQTTDPRAGTISSKTAPTKPPLPRQASPRVPSPKHTIRRTPSPKKSLSKHATANNSGPSLLDPTAIKGAYGLAREKELLDSLSTGNAELAAAVEAIKARARILVDRRAGKAGPGGSLFRVNAEHVLALRGRGVC